MIPVGERENEGAYSLLDLPPTSQASGIRGNRQKKKKGGVKRRTDAAAVRVYAQAHGACSDTQRMLGHMAHAQAHGGLLGNGNLRPQVRLSGTERSLC